ncbi:MAG: phosphate/phosphite/phosphonate ABC transporter substrate-binding protein [Spirochaetota bacterium]|nr:phosphate/phosphite/phosphonate ABC transporter substrate-binding protein [Spirochaetota bacterium]
MVRQFTIPKIQRNYLYRPAQFLMLTLVISLALSFVGCEDKKKESLKNKVKNTQVKPLKICFIPNSPVSKLTRTWEPLVKYLHKETGHPIELDFAKDYQDVIDKFIKGKIDIAMLGAFVYVQVKEKVNVIPLVQRVKKSPKYFSILAVKKNSKLKSLKDLKGRKIAFVDRNSTSGYLIPRVMLATYGIYKPEKYFGEIKWSDNHSNAILLVYTKSVDAAFFASTYWKPYVKDKKLDSLRVLLKSDKVPLGPFCVKSDMDKTLVNKLKAAFLKISKKNSETKDLAKLIKLDGFIESKDSNFDPIRAMSIILKKADIRH